MKKLFFLFWLLPAACMAQMDSTQVKTHSIYCRIFIPNHTSKKTAYLGFDFGHNLTNDLTDQEFQQLAAKLKSFDNDIDAINYMSTQGWEVVNYTVSPERPDAYLLRKKIP